MGVLERRRRRHRLSRGAQSRHDRRQPVPRRSGRGLAHGADGARMPRLLVATGDAPARGRSRSNRLSCLGAFRTAAQAPPRSSSACAFRVCRRQARWGYVKACRKPGEFAHAMTAAVLDRSSPRGCPARGDRGDRRARQSCWRGNRSMPERRGAWHWKRRRWTQIDRPDPTQVTFAAGAGAGGGDVSDSHADRSTARRVTATVTPRTHLADFLREQRLLTGTHLGCEHGVCGACTLLIDGAPARVLHRFPRCAGRCIDHHDRGIAARSGDRNAARRVHRRARAAMRLLHAGNAGHRARHRAAAARRGRGSRVRLELAGNLCRCTGYAGIVRAILRVLAGPAARQRCPNRSCCRVRRIRCAGRAPAPMPRRCHPRRLPPRRHDACCSTCALRQAIGDAVWQAVPRSGAGRLVHPGRHADPDRRRSSIEGEMLAALGPLSARFHGAPHGPRLHAGPITAAG